LEHNGPFGSSLGHFSCFFEGLGLPLVVQHVAPTFLGCWALIARALIFHFQQYDHPTLLHVVAHVKTNTYSF